MVQVLLTEGDIEVFRWVWMLQVLTLEQIRRLRYYQPETGNLSHPDNVRKRMSKLARAGYLSGDDIWDERTHKRQRVYRLGKEALEPLRFHYGIEQYRIHRPRDQHTFRQVHHTLLVTECAVRIVESLRGSSFATLDLSPLDLPFYQTHMVGNPQAKKHVKRFVSQEDISAPGQAKPYRIRPDLVFALGRDKAFRLFLVEADRGTESVMEIGEKLRGYHAYMTSPDPMNPSSFLWQRYGDVRDFRVLMVTTTEKRIGSLRSRLKDTPGFALTAFTTADQMKTQNMIFDEIWTVMDGSHRSLVRPKVVSSKGT